MIAIKTTSDGECFLDLNYLVDFVDITQVEYYELEPEGDSFVLRLYDKDENIIKVR